MLQLMKICAFVRIYFFNIAQPPPLVMHPLTFISSVEAADWPCFPASDKSFFTSIVLDKPALLPVVQHLYICRILLSWFYIIQRRWHLTLGTLGTFWWLALWPHSKKCLGSNLWLGLFFGADHDLLCLSIPPPVSLANGWKNGFC